MTHDYRTMYHGPDQDEEWAYCTCGHILGVAFWSDRVSTYAWEVSPEGAFIDHLAALTEETMGMYLRGSTNRAD